MDFRTQSLLLAAIVAVALAVAMLLRSQRAKALTLFAVLCLSLAASYLGDFLYAVTGHEFWLRAAIANGAAVPAAALAFFLEFLGVSRRSARRGRTLAFIGAFGGLLVAVTPLAEFTSARVVVATWVFGSLTVSLSLLYRRMRGSPSRVERARLTYLLGGAAVALLASALDLLPRLGIPFPSLGPILTTLFLFFLSQTLQVYRLLDLHELLGKFATLSVLALILAAIYAGLVIWVGDRPGLFAFNTLVASFVILNLYEPLRAKVEEWVIATLFRERFELLRTLAGLKARLTSVIDPIELARMVLDTFHESRRVTHASLYLLTDARPGFSLVDARGPAPAPFLDASAARGLLAIARSGQKAVLLENVDRRLHELRRQLAAGARTTAAPTDETARAADEQQRLAEVRSALFSMKAGICIPLLGAERVIGFLNLQDERVPEAYSSDEIALLLEIAEQTATVVENSKLYDRMKERDRLAALGEMAAGLAHEIRNPLGAIKGAAQFLDPQQLGGEEGEFVQVIIDEVDRLNGVVTQFLDYARPLKSTPHPIDVNDLVERTLRLVQTNLPEGIEVQAILDRALPRAQSDAEQLKQVIINLVQNAVQAMPGGGRLIISTAAPEEAGGFRLRGRGPEMVELRVRDDGPGIPENQRDHIFVPFYTTKEKGTGLGLAISQRIVRSHGGSIGLQSRPGEGTEFVVRLPAVEERRAEPSVEAPLPANDPAPQQQRQGKRPRRRKPA
ncbi:ATP-binding protein [Vulgatibacter sp.]|uniref:ATP-binding protein n=1 Tax=Vulgatibacter sp. TaxID=1971226 RepID=UPI00356B4E7C